MEIADEMSVLADHEPAIDDEMSLLDDEHFAAPDEPAWSVPQDEWESVMGYIQQEQAMRAAWEQQQAADDQFQQAAEWEEALREALDPYSESYDPAVAQAMIAELAQGHIDPVVELINAAHQEQQAAATESAVKEGFENAGIPEKKFADAEARADEVYEQMLLASNNDPGWTVAYGRVLATGDQAQVDAFLAYKEQLFAVHALEHMANEWQRSQEVAGAKDELALLQLRQAPPGVRNPQPTGGDEFSVLHKFFTNR
jgi:hypothetical protein